MPVLDVEESPKDGHDRIYDGQGTEKGEFGNLRGLELAVGVPELDGSLPFLDGVAGCEDAVEARMGDFIFECFGVFEVDDFCQDGIPGIVGTWSEDEFASLVLFAGFPGYRAVVADERFLYVACQLAFLL